MRTASLILLAALTLAACVTQAAPLPTPIPSPSRPTTTPPPTATPIVTPTEPDGAAGAAGLPLAADRGRYFSASGACAPCHTSMTDDSGADVSLDSTWRSSMMANAARDPYWRASLSAEVAAHPDLQATIEDQCATCHMPMARFTAAALGSPAAVLGEGFADPANDLHGLAMDGVSCTLCHQIRETGLGPASYGGRFVIDSDLPAGQRLIFGPFSVDEQQAEIMQIASGFIPAQAIPYGRGLHLSQPELCATCHTLYTPYLDATGQVAGEFPEQVTYLEWFYGYSDAPGTSTCQQCHMPAAQGGVRISTTSATLRSPFSQHIFVGGNSFMLRILQAFGEELGVTASSEQFDASLAHTADQLQNRTARVTVDEITLSGSRLTANVTIEVLTGHKFPTGFPARRTWLHFVVQDADGQTVFESGALNPDGSIVGNDADADPATYEPHYQAIVSPDQVQIYEAILRDTEAHVTTSLLMAAGYLKDNRLLPAGFQKNAPYVDIAVRGAAYEDENFQGGGDWIQYSIDVGSAPSPLTVTVELLYQAVGYRWAQNLSAHSTPEVLRFLGYYQQVPNLPVVVASQTVEISD